MANNTQAQIDVLEAKLATFPKNEKLPPSYYALKNKIKNLKKKLQPRSPWEEFLAR